MDENELITNCLLFGDRATLSMAEFGPLFREFMADRRTGGLLVYKDVDLDIRWVEITCSDIGRKVMLIIDCAYEGTTIGAVATIDVPKDYDVRKFVRAAEDHFRAKFGIPC